MTQFGSMLPRKKPAVLVLFLAFLGLSAVNSVGAQVFDLDKGRVALTRLDRIAKWVSVVEAAGE